MALRRLTISACDGEGGETEGEREGYMTVRVHGAYDAPLQHIEPPLN